MVYVVACSPDYFYLLFSTPIYVTFINIIDSTSYCVKCELCFCVDDIFYLMSFLNSASSRFFSSFTHSCHFFSQRDCFLYFLKNVIWKLYYFLERFIFQRVFCTCPLLVMLSLFDPFVLHWLVSPVTSLLLITPLNSSSFIWCWKCILYLTFHLPWLLSTVILNVNLLAECYHWFAISFLSLGFFGIEGGRT